MSRSDDRQCRPVSPSRERRGQGLGRKHVTQLEVSALALMTTTATTAVVGLLFWTAAARMHAAADVGRASAVLSTAAMLAVVASLNVGIVYTRVLPGAGSRSRFLVLSGYALAVGVAGLLSTAFVVLFPYGSLFPSLTDRLIFPVLVVVLALFVLQDWVFVACRIAKWVPIEQLAFSVLKLALLVILAGWSGGALGIVLAWGIPAAAAVFVVSPLLIRYVISREPGRSENAAPLPGRAALGRIVISEYATGITAQIVPLLLPLIVVAKLGTEANAYYAMPWMISSAVTVLIWNICSSFMVEASHDTSQTADLVRRSLKLATLVCAGGMATLLIGAPLLLSVLGDAYATRGTTLLRLMAAALPFTVITTFYTCLSRVQQKMGRVVLIQIATAVAVVGLVNVLTGPLDIDAVGVAYLATEAAVALAVVTPLVRELRTMGVYPGGRRLAHPDANDLVPDSPSAAAALSELKRR